MATRQGVEHRDGAGTAGGPIPAATAARRRRLAAPVDDSPSGRPTRRQWGRVAIGLSISLVGGWLFAALYLAAGGREPVVVVARDVDRYQRIQEDDLTTDRVAAGDQVETISGGRLDELVGRVAATQLTPGMVLSPDHVLDDETGLLGAAEARVGPLLRVGTFPESLSGGDDVVVTIVSESGDEDSVVDTVQAQVWSVTEPEREADANRGDRLVELVVPQSEADEVSAAALQGRVAVYLVPGSG